jgi:hypothetical protein
MMGLEPRAVHILGECPNTELHPQPNAYLLEDHISLSKFIYKLIVIGFTHGSQFIILLEKIEILSI